MVEESIAYLQKCAENTKELRPWIELLLPFYIEAPASAYYHNAFAGGLLVHIVNVMKMIEKMYIEGIKTFSLEDALLAGWLHDVGKIGRIESIENELVLVEPYYVFTNRWQRNPKVPDHVETGQYNLMAIQKATGLSVSWDIWLAITFHCGAYNDNLKWPVKGNETGLMLFLHYCDMIASRFMEQNTNARATGG